MIINVEAVVNAYTAWHQSMMLLYEVVWFDVFCKFLCDSTHYHVEEIVHDIRNEYRSWYATEKMLMNM